MKRILALALLLFVTAGLAGCGNTPAQDRYNAGIDKFNKKDLDGALADFDEAIRLDPNLAVAYMNRGAVYAAKQEFDKAIEDTNKALELKLSNPDEQAIAYTNRALALGEKQEFDKAKADADEAIRIKSDYAKAYYVRGIINANVQDKDSALADLKKAVELSKDAELTSAAQRAITQLESAP